MATLADVLKAIKDLITVTEKVRDNTNRIVKVEEEIHGLKVEITGLREEFRAFREESRLSDLELKGDLKVILTHLVVKEELSALRVQLAEHIAASEKAKA